VTTSICLIALYCFTALLRWLQCTARAGSYGTRLHVTPLQVRIVSMMGGATEHGRAVLQRSDAELAETALKAVRSHLGPGLPEPDVLEVCTSQ
jgi:hypothetical protein